MYTSFLKSFLTLDVHTVKFDCFSNVSLSIFFSGKTTKTPTPIATTHSRRPWTEARRWWAARTRTKPPSELRITHRRARRCCSLPPPVSSLSTAWLLRRRPAQYQCQAPWLYQARTHCTTNTTTTACMTPYWTLWPPTWLIWALKIHKARSRTLVDCTLVEQKRRQGWTEGGSCGWCFGWPTLKANKRVLDEVFF